MNPMDGPQLMAPWSLCGVMGQFCRHPCMSLSPPNTLLMKMTHALWMDHIIPPVANQIVTRVYTCCMLDI